MEIKYNNTTILTIDVEGKETRELMAPCFVEFSFNSSILYSLKAGYYIDVDSKRYWLRYDYKPKKDPLTGGYIYSLRFDSLEALLEDYICFLITPTTKEVNWNLTGTLTQAGQIIASNLAAAGLGIFTVEGSNDVATISGSSSSIASVIDDISNKWGVEWWFEGSVLKFGECKSVASVDFVVGEAISDYQVEESMDSDFATRLYAFGSTKNITSDYRGTGTVMGMVERRLRMPVATGDYLDIAGATRIVEKVKIYEEHYPHRVGTITEAFKVGNFWRFKDDDSPFNPITETLRKGDGTDGNKISVIFESGSLMGREFELLFFVDGSEYVYEVVEKKEGENIDLSVPNNTLHPEVGDTYSLYGMIMPEAFTIAEEVALQNKAQADLIRMYSDKVNYNCPSNPVYCRNNDKKYYIGQSVNLTRHDGSVHATRIRKVERDLYDPYSTVYTLGNKPRYSMYKDIKGKIEKPLTLKQIQTSITTIISDGVITESEKKTLELILKQLSTEYSGVDATFDVVYSNEYLTTAIKADLLSKFNSYSEKYTALVDAINTGIADKFISVAESEAINTGFANYSNAIGLLNTSLESAKKSITDAIGTTLENWVADGVISPLEKLAIRQTRAQVASEKEALVGNAEVFDVDSSVYLGAWSAYDAVLNKYSADTPENITVESDFATAEADYRVAKIALLSAITNVQVDETQGKHPLGGHPDLDFSAKNITSNSIASDNFASNGFMGSGYKLSKDAEGKTKLEVDELLVRQSAKFYELIIQQAKHQGGIVFYTAASMECISVTEQADSYRCFFDTKDGQIPNEWAVNDQARCQRFAGKYYWRKVIAIGTDYIDLSKADTNGAGVPEAGDIIVQLGNRTDTARQAAKVTTVIGADAPRDEFYEGINSFDLTGKLITVVGTKDGKVGIYTTNGEFSGKVSIGAGSSGLSGLSEWAAAAQDIEAAQSTANQAVQSAASLQSFIDNTLPAELSSLQAQIDGKVESWYYDYSPTLANYPAIEWITDVLKDRHIGDTFTNTQEFIDSSTTPDAGKSWRFVKNGSVYSWTPIADSDAVKALLAASKAQDTADGKRRVFVTQPTTPYEVGDLWTQGSAGDIMRCINQRLSGAYVAGDWEKAVKYTDDTAVNEIQIGGRNLAQNSDFSKGFLSWWVIINSSPSSAFEIEDGFLKVTKGSGNADFGKTNFIAENNIASTDKVIVTVWAKGNGTFTARFGTLTGVDRTINTSDVTKYIFYLGSNFGNGNIIISTVSGTISFDRIKIELGNKATDWTPAPEDVQAEIDAAVVKATYWSIKASTPVIYKDAINAATSGTHTPVIVSGELRSGTTTTQGGFITVTPNGGTEAGTATASPVTIAPANGDGKTSYTVKLYDTASKTTLLDTMTIPVVFKGASGVNAISAVLSNEADVLPASSEGVVSDYSGSGTDIIVYEGGTRLTYGTGNGQFQVSASGSGISVGSASTVSGNIRRYANASNMTSDNATIVFTITGKTADGTSFSLTKTQSFAKSKTGQKGDPGPQGVPGQPGADGITTYTWIRYADTSAGAGISNDPTGKLYIGFAYNKTTPSESNNPADYSWSLIKGTDGQPGADGADGQTLYTWIKYADTPTSGMSDSPTGKTYIGIAVNKTTSVESSTYADYTWSLIKGADGKSVTATDVEFAQTASATVAPTTGWQTTAPAWVDGQYIWTRTKTTYSDSTSTYSAAVNLTGPKGLTGNTGSTGTGVDSITEEYYLSTSKTEQTGGDWSTTPPTWSSGKYVWTRVKIVYKNPASTVYTTPVVSSEWEAVNEIQIGGRNYLLNTATPFVVVGNGTSNQTTAGIHNIVNTDLQSNGFVAGDKVVLSYKWRATKTGASFGSGYFYIRLRVGLTSTYVTVGSPSIDVSDSVNSGSVSVPLTLSDNTLQVRFFTPRLNYIPTDVTLIFYDVKIERGNKATDWTPAPEDVQAAIDEAKNKALELEYLKTALAGTTEIQNGLVLTRMMLLKNALEQVTAGISGLTTNDLFLFANDSDALNAALNDIATFTLKRNGTGNLGNLRFTRDGMAYCPRLANGKLGAPIIEFRSTPIPPLSDLVASFTTSVNGVGGSDNKTGGVKTGNFGYSAPITVSAYDNFSMRVQGLLEASINNAGDKPIIDSHAAVNIVLYKYAGGVYTQERVVASLYIMHDVTGSLSDSISVDETFMLSKGTYYLRAEYYLNTTLSSLDSAQISASSLVMTASGASGQKMMIFGSNGFVRIKDGTNYTYMSDEMMAHRGVFDVQGVRGSGSVASNGVMANAFGKATGASRSSNGIYVVNHSVGHTNYGVNLTIISSNAQLNAVVTAKNNTSFEVKIVNASNNALSDSAFDFSMYANV